MSKPIDILQWMLVVGAVTALLSVGWKLALWLIFVDGIVAIARKRWGDV